MKEEQTFRKVVFLDTMTLHYTRLCLEYAEKNDLQFPADEQTISILKNHFGRVSEKPLKESLLKGLETIILLSKNDVQIEYASVSELEMITGIVEGEARIKVAQEGIPYRMWSKFPEREIRDRIAAEDSAAIKDRITARATFNRCGKRERATLTFLYSNSPQTARWSRAWKERVAMKESTLESVAPSMPTWETLEDWTRSSIQALLQRVLEEEVTEFLGRTRYERRSAVDSGPGSRNGHGKRRRLSLMSGTIEVKRPRVRGLEERFESRILPLFLRRTHEVTQLLPELYLHGLSQGDFELALRGLLGDAAPLSPSSIGRLRAKWEEEFETWQERRLDDRELVYAWADGLYVKAGLEKDKAALLVVIGAMSDGRKQVLAIRSGHRESTESWLKVLRDLRDRGLCAPVLLMADGGLPIWSAAEQVWPEAAQQRCWNHKIINVLDDLPKRVQGKARALLTQIPVAETRKEAETRRDTFAARYRERYPAAVATLERDWQRMVTFYDFPEQHWKHLRTTNPVESPFASVRLRTNAGKRYKRVQGATALIWRVLMVAEKRFRKLNAPELLADVFAGDQYQNGKPIQREDASSKEGFKKKAA